MENWHQEARERIYSAFEVGAPPNPATMTVGRPDEDAEELRDRLAGRPWPALMVLDFDRLRDEIWLLSPEALRYYLPGFMLMLLNDREDEGDVLYDYVASMLQPPTYESSHRDEFWQSLNDFTPQQAHAIAAWAAAMLEKIPDEDFEAIAFF